MPCTRWVLIQLWLMTGTRWNDQNCSSRFKNLQNYTPSWCLLRIPWSCLSSPPPTTWFHFVNSNRFWLGIIWTFIFTASCTRYYRNFWISYHGTTSFSDCKLIKPTYYLYQCYCLHALPLRVAGKSTTSSLTSFSYSRWSFCPLFHELC